jgi:protein ImuB
MTEPRPPRGRRKPSLEALVRQALADVEAQTARRIACIRLPPPPAGAPPPGAEALAALAGALLRAAPRVTPARGHPRALWADAGGMERRGGDLPVARALLEAAREAGFDVKVGVAATCIAAAAATRERGTAIRIVPPGADARYLARRPLSLLPVPAALRETLALLGIRTCGALAALDAADVELRFGAAGLEAWRLACAEDPRWPFRPPAPGMAQAEVELEPPIDSTEPLRFVLPGLIDAVCRQLAARQRIPARLRLVLTVDGIARADDAREVRPARPTANPRVLADLCRRAAEQPPPGGPLAGVRLEAVDEAAARADQLDAFRPPAPDPGALHAALLPVFARWGDGALSAAVLHGAHLPAEHAAWEPLGSDGIAAFAHAPLPAPDDAGDALPELGRACLDLCLRRLPEPLPVRVREGAGRRPLEVELQSLGPAQLGRTGESFPPGVWKTRSEGPERISGGWWAGGSAREYWRVESPEGWLGVVFRDAVSGAWYLEGWYD